MTSPFFLCYPKLWAAISPKSIDGTDLRFHTVHLIANPTLPRDFYQNVQERPIFQIYKIMKSLYDIYQKDVKKYIHS